jgi:putative serine protease PepD
MGMSESDTSAPRSEQPAMESDVSAESRSTNELPAYTPPSQPASPGYPHPAQPPFVPYVQQPAPPQPAPPPFVAPQSAPPQMTAPQITAPQSAPPHSAPPNSAPPSIWSQQGAAPGGYPAGQWFDGTGYPPQGPPGMPPQPPGVTQPIPGRPGRLGRTLGLGALALVLAGGGGVVGGAIVHATDSNSGSSGKGPSASSRGSATTLDHSSLAGIVANVKDSVVSIFTQDAEGSGVVLDTDGHILTNNHVVADAQGGTVRVTFANGKSVSAKVDGTDTKTDLAVVQVSGVSDLSPAKLGDSDALQVGDSVIAIGSPLGLDGSVTAGIVSALNRTIDEGGNQQQNPFSQQNQSAGTAIAGAIQTDAAINPGNSGGALVNMAGEVVGINTAIETGGTGSSGNIGVGFAIPSNRAKEVANSLIKGQKVSHPYIGVNVGTANGNAGAQVASVVGGGPAAKGGVQEGDVITKVGGTDIHTQDDLLNVVQAAKVGDQLKLTVNRGGSEKDLTVTVGESPN